MTKKKSFKLKPATRKTKSLRVKITPFVHVCISKLAKSEERSISSWVTIQLLEVIKNQTKKKPWETEQT